MTQHKPHPTQRRHIVAPVLVLLLAAWLQVGALSSYNRFHPDEAFFMTFARHAAVNGDWLLPGSLDKPPVSIYMNALGLMALAVDADAAGVLHLDVYKGEFAARTIGVMQGVLLAALLMAIAWYLTGQRHMALLTGLLLALSPYVIAFAPTAFTDLPMLLFGMLAWLLALRGRYAWAGVFFALSFAAKPQAIYLLPLLLWAVLRLQKPPAAIKRLMAFGLPLLLGVLLLLGWDAARPEQSVFALGASNNALSGGVLPPDDWLRRIAAWWDWVQYLFGNAVLTLLLIVAGFALGWRLADGGRWCWLWLVAYATWHIVLPINVYDRYVLLAVPVVVLLASIGLHLVLHRARWLALLLIVLLAFGAWQASMGMLPIGSDRGQAQGIDMLAEALNRKPVATVVYDHWLGWLLGYYMGPWTDKRRVYYPTPEALVADALALPERGVRYLPIPDAADAQPWLAALRQAGFQVYRDGRMAHITLYALVPPD